jgi:hypothetical protein
MHRSSRSNLLSPDDPGILQLAKTVRMRLLQFRFEHYRSLSIPIVPADVQLSARALDLYRALALPFGENQVWCDLLARLVASQRLFTGAAMHSMLQRFCETKQLSNFFMYLEKWYP